MAWNDKQNGGDVASELRVTLKYNIRKASNSFAGPVLTFTIA